jgi:hypothetical protein
VAGETIADPFLQAYLPDPLGHPEDSLRSTLFRAARSQNNATPVTWMSHAMKKAARRIRRALRSGHRPSTEPEVRNNGPGDTRTLQQRPRRLTLH